MVIEPSERFQYDPLLVVSTLAARTMYSPPATNGTSGVLYELPVISVGTIRCGIPAASNLYK